VSVTINTYTGLLAGVLARLARQGDVILSAEFDNFLANTEQRMYYGYATEDMGNPLRSEPLRIVEMEVVNPSFALDGQPTSDSARITQDEDIRVIESASDDDADLTGTVAQPTDFLELISAYNNDDNMPMEIVAQRVIDSYGPQSLGRVGGLIAVSGENFRVFDPPGAGATATLRYYQKLATPTAQEPNDILANYPNVYLYGCLMEAAVFMQDEVGALRYLQLYNASVSGLNSRTQRITASANPRMRVRAYMP
jgi:hypothetical protein